jgi:hypothetical protein
VCLRCEPRGVTPELALVKEFAAKPAGAERFCQLGRELKSIRGELLKLASAQAITMGCRRR